MQRRGFELVMIGGLGFVVAGITACDDPCPESGADVPERLCEWRLFEGDMADQEPADGVVPFDVISVLYTDDAHKRRFVRLPGGQTIGYSETEKWTFPVGTVLVKSFAYPEDARDPDSRMQMIETRLLVHDEPDRWKPYVYRWNEEQTDAERFLPGTRLPIAWTDAAGERREQTYRIPSEEDCKTCHAGKEEVDVLGPRTRQLNRTVDWGDGKVNQIDWFVELGLLDATPMPADSRQTLVDPFGDASIEVRARSYLDGNCSHCHRKGGDAQSSGLWLNWENEEPERLGVCKIPAAAGRGAGGLDFDIVPGDPEASIMVFRMESREPDITMPELGGLQTDPQGTEVIREWIANMEPEDCGGY